MIEECPKKRLNVFLLATIVTVIVVSAQIITRYFLGNKFEIIETAIFAVFVWIAFFFIHKMCCKRK